MDEVLVVIMGTGMDMAVVVVVLMVTAKVVVLVVVVWICQEDARVLLGRRTTCRGSMIIARGGMCEQLVFFWRWGVGFCWGVGSFRVIHCFTLSFSHSSVYSFTLLVFSLFHLFTRDNHLISSFFFCSFFPISFSLFFLSFSHMLFFLRRRTPHSSSRQSSSVIITQTKAAGPGNEIMKHLQNINHHFRHSSPLEICI